MPMLLKHVIFSIVSLAVILICLQIFVVPQYSHETRAIIFRVQYVVTIQCTLSIASFFLWRTLKPLPLLLKSYSRNNYPLGSNSAGKELGRKTLLNNKHCSTSDTSLNNKDKSNFVWTLFLGLFIFLCHFSYVTNVFLLSAEPHWLCMLTYGCLGTLIQFTIALLIVKCLSWAVQLMKSYATTTGQNKILESKGLSQKTVIYLTLFYTLCATMLGLYKASLLPPVKRVDIPIRNLPRSLHNFHIVQLSDIHLGPTVGRTKLQGIVDIVNSENADVVVITGDLVDGSAEKLQEAASPLKSVRSQYGTMFISGNHEYYTGDVDNWFKLLKLMGVTVLHNSNVKVPSEDRGHICFAGTNDMEADVMGYGDHTFDATKAVTGCDKNGPIILLAHQPKAAKAALDLDIGIDLVLSGHTHGGQMFPMILTSYLFNPFFAGLYQYKGGQVYVSTGTQYWGIPMRLGTSMEITSITLRLS